MGQWNRLFLESIVVDRGLKFQGDLCISSKTLVFGKGYSYKTVIKRAQNLFVCCHSDLKLLS